MLKTGKQRRVLSNNNRYHFGAKANKGAYRILCGQYIVDPATTLLDTVLCSKIKVTLPGSCEQPSVKR